MQKTGSNQGEGSRGGVGGGALWAESGTSVPAPGPSIETRSGIAVDPNGIAVDPKRRPRCGPKLEELPSASDAMAVLARVANNISGASKE